MAPPLEPFLPADLDWRVQVKANGKRRKQAIELEKCALKEIVQYDCQVQYKDRNDKVGTIVCSPVTRLFRRCANGLTVETTEWEKQRWATNDQTSQEKTLNVGQCRSVTT